jgi:hypothetical protein
VERGEIPLNLTRCAVQSRQGDPRTSTWDPRVTALAPVLVEGSDTTRVGLTCIAQNYKLCCAKLDKHSAPRSSSSPPGAQAAAPITIIIVFIITMPITGSGGEFGLQLSCPPLALACAKCPATDTATFAALVIEGHCGPTQWESVSYAQRRGGGRLLIRNSALPSRHSGGHVPLVPLGRQRSRAFPRQVPQMTASDLLPTGHMGGDLSWRQRHMGGPSLERRHLPLYAAPQVYPGLSHVAARGWHEAACARLGMRVPHFAARRARILTRCSTLAG